MESHGVGQRSIVGRARAGAGTRRVLLAEDDPDMRRLIAMHLRDAGHEIVEVRDGIETLDQIESIVWSEKPRPFDVIVSDVRMPGLSALELLESLPHTLSTTPVILITAFADEEMRARARALGAAAVLDKPVDPAHLRTAVTEVTARPPRADAALSPILAEPPSTLSVAGTAHEIGNLLFAVRTYLKLLPRPEGNGEVVGLRNLAVTQLQRAMELTAELMGRRTPVRADSASPTDAIEPLTRLLESVARLRGVALTIRCEPGLPATRASAHHVRQIVLNLLLNAIEASPAGSEVALDLRAAGRQQPAVVLEVRDQGTGIAPEHLERIFDPLFTTKEHGSGLGLTMVQDMVAQHGGHVAVESVPGGGTTFQVTLPAEQPHQASLALDAPVRVGHAARTRVVH